MSEHAGAGELLGAGGSTQPRGDGSTSTAGPGGPSSEAILDSLFDGAGFGLAVWDLQMVFVRVNSVFAEINGLPVEDHLGRPAAEVLLDLPAEVLDAHANVLKTGSAVRDLQVQGGSEATATPRSFKCSYYPLRDHGELCGVLAYVREVTEEVRALEGEQRIAAQLELSLMPGRLPAVPGADIASAFRPAGDQHQIGGDFFDVFPMGPECWMIVIGDVCGKGAQAASLTALARYTLRAAAIQAGAKPRELLAQLNEAILRQRQDTSFLTAICAFLERAEGGALRLTLSVAGHPPPLLLTGDGSVTEVGGRGGLLGVWEEPSLSEEAVELRPGERLVLYTDGVVEVGAPADELGQEGLAKILATAPQGRAADTVSAIDMAVVSRAAPARDDVAVLVVRADPDSARSSKRGR